MRWRNGILFVLSLPLAVSVASSIASGADQIIKAPCVPDAEWKSAGFMRKCSDLLNGPKGTIATLDQQIKTAVDDPTHSIYTGEIVDLGTEKGQFSSRPFGKPVCLPLANPFNNGIPENDSNHHGQSCGRPAYFQVNVSGSGVNTLMHMYGDMGTMEGSYFRGTWVQALTCHWQEVRNEIQNSRAVRNLSPGCSAMAQTYAKLQEKGKTQGDQVTGLAGQANLADIWACDGKSGGLRSNVMQSAQQLCAARASIESLFMRVAECEINQRAEKAFRNIAPDPERFVEEIKSVAVKNCNMSCNAQCASCANKIKGAASRCSECGTKCANQCYPNELRKFIGQKLQPLPNNGSCSL